MKFSIWDVAYMLMGVHTVEAKITAVVDPPTQTSATELKAFVGL